MPDEASLRGEFRSMNLETIDSLRLQVGEALDKVRRMYPDAKIEDHLHIDFETYELSDDEPALLRVKSALRSIGLEPTMKPSGGGTDGNVFRLNGINAVVVGMAVYNMHTVREHVEIPELVDAAHLCETLLRAYEVGSQRHGMRSPPERMPGAGLRPSGERRPAAVVRPQRGGREEWPLPRPDAECRGFFESIVPDDARVHVRPMFGNVAGFVNGNMFIGLFGADLFVRLSDEDRAELLQERDAAILEAMKGRPMKEYVVVPEE